MAEHALGCSLFFLDDDQFQPALKGDPSSVIELGARNAFFAHVTDTGRVRLRAKFREKLTTMQRDGYVSLDRGGVFSSLMPTSPMDQISIPCEVYPTVPDYPYVGKPTDVIAYIPFSRSVCQFSKCN